VAPTEVAYTIRRRRPFHLPLARLGSAGTDGGTTIRIVVANDLDPGAGDVGAGGAEVHVARLVAGLREHGHDVAQVVAPPRQGFGRLRDVWDPRARRMVAQAAADLDADVVHVHNFARELSASALFAGAWPVVHTVHDHHLLHGPVPGAPGSAGLRGTAKRAKGALDRLLVRRRADGIVAVSAALAEELRAAGFGDVTVIGGFIPDPTTPALPPGGDVVFVGRLAVEKRPELAIRAFAEVAERHPTVTLQLVGDGPMRAELEALVAELGLQGRVRFHGNVEADRVSDHLTAARVVLAPSERESFGLVVTEAMVAGRPVVASDIPAFREQVTDGTDGWLVGGTGGFAAALDEALADPEEAARRGRAAAASARARATTSVAVARHLDVYRGAIARHAGTGDSGYLRGGT